MMQINPDFHSLWHNVSQKTTLVTNAEDALLMPSLFKHLPGRTAQWRMATSFRVTDPSPDRLLEVRKSAVLLLVNSLHIDGRAQLPQDIGIILTLRRADLSHHGGQISFPGGRIEIGENIATAALRETEEEIGISSKHITLLGSLTPLYVPVSNNYIFPLIGIIPPEISFNPDEQEVAEVFRTSITDLLNPDCMKKQRRVIQGYDIEMPYWDIHPTTPLWGATAMIISEFLALFEIQESNKKVEP